MNLAQQAFESMVDLEGVVIGVESCMITDDQLIEWLTIEKAVEVPLILNNA